MGQQKTQLRNERYRSSMSADTPANVGPITVADSGQRSFRDRVWDRCVFFPTGCGQSLFTDSTRPSWCTEKIAGELFSKFVLSDVKNRTVLGEAYRFIQTLRVLDLIYWLVVF